MGRGNDGRAHGGGRSINSAERRAYRSLQALITLPLSISNSSFSSSSSSESSSEEVFVFVVILLFLVPCCASPRLHDLKSEPTQQLQAAEMRRCLLQESFVHELSSMKEEIQSHTHRFLSRELILRHFSFLKRNRQTA